MTDNLIPSYMENDEIETPYDVFCEHWIVIRSDEGLKEQYPYSAFNNIRLMKRLKIIYLEKMCRLKVMAPIPLSSFPEVEV